MILTFPFFVKMKNLTIKLCLGFCFCILIFSNSSAAQNKSAEREVEFRKIELSRCADWVTTQGDKYGRIAVTSGAQLRSLLEKMPKFTGECENYQMPAIDFDKFMLIGNTFFTGGCAAGNKFKINIFRDDGKKIFRYSLGTRIAPCRGTTSHDEWILTERLPDDYKIVFEEYWLEKTEKSQNR